MVAGVSVVATAGNGAAAILLIFLFYSGFLFSMVLFSDESLHQTWPEQTV
jgi:hypothetical protein